MINYRNRLMTAILLCGLILAGCSMSPKAADQYLRYRNVDVVEVSVDGDVPDYLSSSLSEIYSLVRSDNFDDGRYEKLRESSRASGTEIRADYCFPSPLLPDSSCSYVESGYKYNLEVTRTWGDQKSEYTRFYTYAPKSISSRHTPDDLDWMQPFSKERAVEKWLGEACAHAKSMFNVDVPVTALSSDIEYVSSACLEWLPDYARKDALKTYVVDESLSPSISWRAAEYLERKDFYNTGLPILTGWFHDSAPERRRIAIKFDKGECALAAGETRKCAEINFTNIASFLDDGDAMVRLEAAKRIVKLAEWFPRSGPEEDRERRQRLVNEIGQGMASHPDARIRMRGLRLVDLDSLKSIATNDPFLDVRELAEQFWKELKQLCEEGSNRVADRC